MSNAVRFLASLLALLAVSAALARPVCELDHVTGSEPQQQDCCASLDDWMAASAPEPVAPIAEPPAAALVGEAWRPSWRPSPRSLAVNLPSDRPPLSRRYHVRSARILI